MGWKETEVQFSINGKQYSLFIVKRLLKKDMIRLYERTEDNSSVSKIMPIKISTSTFGEIARFWLEELKGYLVKKRSQKKKRAAPGRKDNQLTEKDLHCLARQIQSWSAPKDESLNTSQRYYACVYCKYVHDCETPVVMHQKKVLNKLSDLTGVHIFPGLRYLYWQFLPASRFLECPEELPVLKEIHKDMKPDEYQEYKNYLDELIERSKEVSGLQQGSFSHKDS